MPGSSILCFGEILLRLAAPRPGRLFQEMRLDTSFCGAEANVAVALSGFGHRCTMVSALPASSVGEAARRALRAFGVDLSATLAGDGRMGLYYLEPGAMMRPSAVIYDRAGSAFAGIDAGSHDWDGLLAGAGWLFVSGITAALGDGPLAALRHAMARANALGVRVAFDTNYRPALWQGRETMAAEVMRALSSHADLLFAGRRAATMMTGKRFDAADPAQGFADAAAAMFACCPRLGWMAATRRELLSSDSQRLTGLIAHRDGIATTPTFALDQVVDRIGTGDAFAAGVVHGVDADWPAQGVIDFATAAARLAHAVPGDFLRAGVAEVEALAAGGQDVRR